MTTGWITYVGNNFSGPVFQDKEDAVSYAKKIVGAPSTKPKGVVKVKVNERTDTRV